MFNNSFDYLEGLFGDGQSLESALDNRAERFATASAPPSAPPSEIVFKQTRVDSLLWAYREIGYLYANLNPFGEEYARDYTRVEEYRNSSYRRLEIESFDLSEADLDTDFFGGKSAGKAPLRDIVARFKRTYCGFVGVEFLHIRDKLIRDWFIERFESSENATVFSASRKRIILDDLIKTEEMENFLHSSFIGQKRFSIQGADVTVPVLHFLVDKASDSGIEDIVMGTSHRGRLSILNLILDKSPEDIFYLFEDDHAPGVPGGSGDVKYHIGYCARHAHADGTSVNITLLPNSSHLESVDAIVEGNARGLQDLKGDVFGKRVLPIIIHGDASFAGQGVVSETFNLSRLPDYSTGGTVHIVINNQVGFTTSPLRGRSGLNPTDVARAVEAPVLHVNGDEPEAAAHAALLALDFRQEFNRDIVIDIVCYRRHGHNEGDEPSYTQPYMYSLIKDHQSAAALYLKKCLEEGVVESGEIEESRAAYIKSLNEALSSERRKSPGAAADSAEKTDVWSSTGVRTGADPKTPETSVPENTLQAIAGKVLQVPEDFGMQPRLRRLLEGNYKKFTESGMVDWALAESMAFGSLLLEGIPVRLSGQDSERGTFSHRHLVWWEKERENCCSIIPLQGLSADQAQFAVCNSPLAEYSVLAFEFGYSVSRMDALVLWEAQFGDFVNGAQVIVDSYVAAARSKWNVHADLVLLLPHGYEGLGPEHSNGHLARFLQLCAENNMTVCNPTTPSQYFHLLRNQKKRRYSPPLVLMTPKSLLRLPASFSPLGELADGAFRKAIDDGPSDVTDRLLFCSGKIYYELKAAQVGAEGGKRVRIARMEQLYPFPADEIGVILKSHGTGNEIFWVQEEPKNRGAWTYIRGKFDEDFPETRIGYIGREPSASPAAGTMKQHREEQGSIVLRAVKGIAAQGANR